MGPTINIAISKGRIFEAMRTILVDSDLSPVESFERNRKLFLASKRDDVKIAIIRGTDVPTYVAYGAAQLGVVGKDILMEYDAGDIYELLDLRIACCRLVVAGPAGERNSGNRARVATKYVSSTRRHFAKKSEQVEIIKLYGSMELAPLVGLSDLIVDLTDTGSTLRANHLVVKEEVAKISARLIVNKAAMKMQREQIQNMVNLLRKAVE